MYVKNTQNYLQLETYKLQFILDFQVKLIKEEFGYDDGFNYNKESDFDAALSKQ